MARGVVVARHGRDTTMHRVITSFSDIVAPGSSAGGRPEGPEGKTRETDESRRVSPCRRRRRRRDTIKRKTSGTLWRDGCNTSARHNAHDRPPPLARLHTLRPDTLRDSTRTPRTPAHACRRNRARARVRHGTAFRPPVRQSFAAVVCDPVHAHRTQNDTPSGERNKFHPKTVRSPVRSDGGGGGGGGGRSSETARRDRSPRHGAHCRRTSARRRGAARTTKTTEGDDRDGCRGRRENVL